MLFKNMCRMMQSLTMMILSSGVVLGFTTTATFMRHQSNHMMTINDNNNNMDHMDAMKTEKNSSSRRHFMNTMIGGATMMSTVFVGFTSDAANAATTTPEILTTSNGIKYAIIKKVDEKRTPFDKDIVAIEYTGYLLDGSIFGMFIVYILFFQTDI